MTQEVLKLALDALEANDKLINGTGTNGGLVYCMDGYYSDCFDVDPINKQTEEAITAIKEALAQPERDYERGFIDGMQKQMQSSVDKAVNRMAQPEQEPVAGEWVVLSESVGKLKELGWNDEAIHRANTPQRTWVGLAAEDRLTAKYMQDAPDGIEAVIDYIEAKLREKNSQHKEKNT